MLIGTKFGIMKKSLHLKYRILFISLGVLDIFNRVIEKTVKGFKCFDLVNYIHETRVRKITFSHTLLFLFL